MDDMALVREYAAHQSEAAFAELVSRHLSLVYSAAMRQMRAPHLAEEVAQTVFIILARKAARLRAGTVLPAWLLTTTRYAASAQMRTAIRRQQREQEAHMQSLLNEPDPWPEIAPLLDEAIASLGETDRNAIVLRFFQNKPLAEVGAGLGASEDAARVRVNRALEKLRKLFAKRGVTLSATVIASAVAANSVQAAPAGLVAAVSATAAKGAMATIGIGIGSKLLSVLGKTFLFSWFVPLFSLVATLPSLAIVSVLGRMERKNFRDSEGFRPQLHLRFSRSYIWGFPLVLVAFVIINHSAVAALGISGQELLLVGFVVLLTLIAARSLTIARSPYQIAMFVYCLIITVGISGVKLGWIPRHLSQLPMLAGTILLLLFIKKRPMRMDYSLFLRAAHGLLRISDTPDDIIQSNTQFDRKSLLGFARFLGSRLLVINFRWQARGLMLRLAPVGNRFLTNLGSAFMPPISRGCSHILLGWDGTVLAHCSKRDATDLTSLNTGRPIDPPQLECLVGKVVGQGWRDYREGNIAAAEGALGQLPEAAIFVVPPARAKSMLWWRMLLGVAVLGMLFAMVLQYWRPPWMDGMKPVSVTEGEVRAFLGNIRTNPNPILNHRQRSYPGDPTTALFGCLVLPSTNLFAPEGLQAMRDVVAGNGGFELVRTQSWRAQWVFNAPLARCAMAGGWITWNDLAITPADSAAQLHTLWKYSPLKWDDLLTRCEAWSWVKQEHFHALRIGSDGVTQLQLFRAVNCLDQIDQGKLIQQIASVQVLSGTPPG
jgi:RNA polymerase sigma factor (sigma-70 family)